MERRENQVCMFVHPLKGKRLVLLITFRVCFQNISVNLNILTRQCISLKFRSRSILYRLASADLEVQLMQLNHCDGVSIKLPKYLIQTIPISAYNSLYFWIRQCIFIINNKSIIFSHQRYERVRSFLVRFVHFHNYLLAIDVNPQIF